MVPWEQASKQAPVAMISPPACTWILRRPPLISSTMRAKRWAEARRRSRLGCHAVEIRHWTRDWAWTMGASREAAAPAATRAAPLRMNRRRPSMSSLRLLDGADREAGDEAIEEEIVAASWCVVGARRRRRRGSERPEYHTFMRLPVTCYPCLS